MPGMSRISALLIVMLAALGGARGDAPGAGEPGSIACIRRPDSSDVRLCEAGLCAGVDGECHPAANEAVASGFTLVNARWPKHSLHLSPGKLGTSPSQREAAEVHLDLFALPRKAGHEQAFVLASRGGKTAASCTSVGSGASCIATAADASTAAAVELGVRFALAPWYEGAPPGAQTLMIEAVGSPGAFFAVDGPSPLQVAAAALQPAMGGSEALPLDVIAASGVGVGAFWIADPPLPLELPPYTGPRCVLNCGAFGSGGSDQGSRRLWLIRFLALCGFLLTLTLGGLGYSLFHLMRGCSSKDQASRQR